mgnify:CR=1 FL=1
MVSEMNGPAHTTHSMLASSKDFNASLCTGSDGFLPISIPPIFQRWRICRGRYSSSSSLFHVIVGSSRNPGHPRGPIWKGRVLSNEAMRVVQELKRAKSCDDDGLRVSNILKSKAARLLKLDMMAVLGELRRQNQCDLMLKVRVQNIQ